jgi:subtilase family serine protease
MRTRNRLDLLCLAIVASGTACASPDTGSTDSTPIGVAASASRWGGSPTLDLGSTDPTQVVSVSLVFQVQNQAQLEAYVQATQTPGSPTYHRFLSVDEFARSYAPSASSIARVARYLTSFGIQPGAILADNLVLKATGTVGAFTQAFTFQMHDFQSGSKVYHRPTQRPRVPAALSDVMLVVTGFSSQPSYVPNVKSAASFAPTFTPAKALPPAGSTATNTPGAYTVGDFANRYDVNPLYRAHIDGTGSTLGIATLAGFYPADAYTYWSSIGLQVRQDRITQVHVDDGAPIGSAAGSIETSLDVEQSGGLAPNANIVVYDAPNTDGGFLDLFYQAASDNLVDSLSVSWGSPEIFYNAALAGADLTSELGAFHQVLLEGAAQGISIFASAGDSGAYDMTPDGLDPALAVDAPASDPAITAAGGTTTPYAVTATDFGATGGAVFSVTQEQVWGWDALQSFLVANVSPSFAGTLFSVGGGGGVSSFWPAPYYQRGYPGVQRTQPGQVVSYEGQTLLDLPENFAGRNLPDVSANADPFSGYSVYSTSDGGWNYGYGGTSFVAPQLNGCSALIRQLAGGRVGLWNAALYRFAKTRGGNASVVDITAGDDWFYAGVPGYDPASGVGVLDVANFARAFARGN